MKILIQHGRVIDPHSQTDRLADVAIEAGKVIAIGAAPEGFVPQKSIDASQCVVAPGLVDLAVRLREPGDEHAGLLESELHAAATGGVCSLVCPPDTDPVLDEPGLVRMLKFRAEKLHSARVYPLGALTHGLKGETLTEMAQLAKAGCVGFSQADVPVQNSQFLLRAFQYASTFGQTIWLCPNDPYLGTGVAASGAMATRLGLSGSPVMAETIPLFIFLQMAQATGCRLHISKLSSAQGVELVRQAKAQGVNVTADVSINSLHLTDVDIGFFDSRARLTPPLRQQRDREALQQGLQDGTIDALVSDHHPLPMDAKAVPFASATPGATGVELLLSLALKWASARQVDLVSALNRLTHGPAQVIAASGAAGQGIGQLTVGGPADLCIFDPHTHWRVLGSHLRSQGKSTPFSGYEVPGQVMATLVAGHVVFER